MSMSLPFFYINEISSAGKLISLDEETSKHVVQVLRMKEGEKIRLTNGRGLSAEAVITAAHKKHSSVQLGTLENTLQPSSRLSIAISLVKNASRFEWFVEKATEFGVHEIIPMICERTERQKFRSDRMQGICKSAMLQSMQSWLPVLSEPQDFDDVITFAKQQQKMIAHCVRNAKVEFASLFNPSLQTHIILIGPEGDFTPNEIEKALEKNFTPVSLGENRLRTETAGIFAAAWASGAREED